MTLTSTTAAPRQTNAGQADQEPVLTLQAEAEQRRGLAANPEAIKAARILGYIRDMPDHLGIQTVTLNHHDDAVKLFHLSPQMDRQAVVVTLANQVGYRALQQAYYTLYQRQLTTDFKGELGSITASRSGFGLNAADQARLTNLMLDQHAADRWVVGNDLMDAVGHAERLGANLLMGSTRQLAHPPGPIPGAVQKRVKKAARAVPGGSLLASMQGAKVTLIDDPKLLDALIRDIEDARREGHLEAFLKAFEQGRGKSLYAYLGEVVREPTLRQRVLKHLPPPISDEQLTYDAFLENIAIGMTYADNPGAQLEGREAGYKDEKRHGDPAALLKYFGYRASDLYAGKWGFEMRVFTPIPGKARSKDVIVAFRGTQGISFNLKANPAGTVDTEITDFAPSVIGENQFQQNIELIRHVIQGVVKAGPLLMTGHSLGGALAQLAAEYFKEHTRRVVTFQGANIDQARVNELVKYNSTTATPITATHYRMDGDTVPTGGEAIIPGMIHYFDANWQLKPQSFGETILNKLPFAQRASYGHVIPLLNMYVQGMQIPKDQTGLKLLQDKGVKDEQQQNHGATVQLAYAGKYDATRNPARDPRISLETGREALTALNAKLSQDYGVQLPILSYREVYEHELPYNTLLAHLEDIALNQAKDYGDFEKKALKLLGLDDKKYNPVRLTVMNQDRKLGEQLGQQVPHTVDVPINLIDDIVPRDALAQNHFERLHSLWNNYR